MSIYRVTQLVRYTAEAIEADSEDDARDTYLKDQEDYYDAVVDEDIELVEENN